MGERHSFEITDHMAHQVHAAAMQESNEKPEKGGRKIIDAAMKAIADHVCRDKGHRYHAHSSRLYCRRCGTIRAIEDVGDNADG